MLRVPNAGLSGGSKLVIRIPAYQLHGRETYYGYQRQHQSIFHHRGAYLIFHRKSYLSQLLFQP
jgi:hypothetical protein